MIITLAYGPHDSAGALRLIKWMGFLSEAYCDHLKHEKILLVASHRATRTDRHKQICAMAALVFGEARCHVPETEHEVGWPGAANFMFREALLHIEKHFPDDMLWLEADATPTKPSWLADIEDEWEIAVKSGKSFLGAFVPHNVNHMTGIAVYSRDWRQRAPRLCCCPDHDAWDCFAAPEVLPNAKFTTLIQHVFKRHERGWAIPAMAILDPRAAIFHQDKTGKLVQLLDEHHFGGECLDHPLYGYRYLSYPEKVMWRFYHCANASKGHKAGNMVFHFDHVAIHGGAMQGAYATDEQEKQLALDELVHNPASGITEMTKDQWEGFTKKKISPEQPGQNISNALARTYPPIALTPTPSKSPAVLVEVRSTPLGETSVDLAEVTDINEVIKVGKVADPVVGPVPIKSKRPRK